MFLLARLPWRMSSVRIAPALNHSCVAEGGAPESRELGTFRSRRSEVRILSGAPTSADSPSILRYSDRT